MSDRYGWLQRGGSHPPRKQKGGFSRVIARLERGRRKKQKGGGWFDGSVLTKKNKKFFRKKQKGGSWFDGLSQTEITKKFCTLPESKKGVVGSTVYPRVCLKQNRGKKKRKPAVIHSAAMSYPQKGGGGKYGGFKGFFENPFHVREKLGVGNKGKKQKV
jgi:hypothetical protein